MFTRAYNKMNIKGQRETHIHIPLQGFTGDTILLEGVVSLPAEMDDTPQHMLCFVYFFVVNCTNPYNAIINYPTLNAIQVVTSTYHLMVKLPTLSGIGVMKVLK